MVTVEEGPGMAKVELVRVIADRATRRDEAKGAILAGLPGEVGRASHDIFEKPARGNEGVDEIVLDASVATENQYPLPMLAQA